MTIDSARETMEHIGDLLVKEFFKDRQDIVMGLEVEMKKILTKQGLPFTLPTFKAMMSGMELYHASQDKNPLEDIQKPSKGIVAMMYVRYLVVTHREKVAEAIDKNLK